MNLAAFLDYWLLIGSSSCFDFPPILPEVTGEERTKTETVAFLFVVTGTAGFPSVIFGLLPIENYAFIAEPGVFSTGSQLETCVEHIVCLRLRICAVDQIVCGKTLNLVGQKSLKTTKL